MKSKAVMFFRSILCGLLNVYTTVPSRMSEDRLVLVLYSY